MQIIDANVVRGSAQPGLEVEFCSEGGETVSDYLKAKDFPTLSDEEVIARAKGMLIEVAGCGWGQPA